MSSADVRDALAGIGAVALAVWLLRPGGPGHLAVTASGEALAGALI